MAQPEPTWDLPEQPGQSDQSSVEVSKDPAHKQSEDAEGVITFKPRTVTCPQGAHSFYYTDSMAVKCKGCPIGYSLGVGTYLKDGHIYKGEQLLI